jgi:signal transduction histidine kinase
VKSLLSRLSLGLGLSLVLLFAAQWWIVDVVVKSLTENQIVTRLEHDTESILAAAEFSEQGKLQIEDEHINLIYQRPFSGHYYSLKVDQEKTLFSRSLWDKQFPVYREVSEPQHLVGPDNQTLLAIMRDYFKEGHKLHIVVAEDISPLLQQLDHFEKRYAVLSMLMLLFVLALQAVIARVSLRPLKLVIKDMKQLEMGEIARLREEVPEEVRPLVREFNQLLQLMRERLDRSRAALGNLAHALKTPLTVLTRLEDSDELQQYDQVRRQLRDQTGEMRQMIERQLKRARLAGASTPGLHFEAVKELEGLAQILRQIYGERGIDIDLNLPDAKVYPGDREDMLELFGNLLDNACKWAANRVRVTVTESPGLSITIEDDGPGCPRELRQELAQRGRRLDESTAGHGLGLAIVRDIVENYQGELSFGESEALGGFRVDVTLPGRG